MIKDGLTIKAFYKNKEVKIIELHHINYFFDGLFTLKDEWKIEPFVKLWQEPSEIRYMAMTLLIGLLHKDMCNKTWEVNEKRFKNEMLLRNKKPKVFLLESDYLTVPKNQFDNALRLLKFVGLVRNGSHHSYIRLNDVHVGYCRKLGNYLFNTEYCKRSFENNRHYFGSHSSYEHRKAYLERSEIDTKVLN